VTGFPPIRQPRVRRWRRLFVLLPVLAGMLALGVVGFYQRRDGLPTGPVSLGGDGTANGQPIDVGVDFSFGYMLWNHGKRPAMVERVRVLGVTGPISVVDVWAHPFPSQPKPYTFMSAFGFPPPPYPSKPLSEEHVVPVPKTFTESGSPYEGLQLVVGVKSTGPGVGRIRGIEVTYRVGSRRYRNSSEGNGFLCAPAAEYAHGGPRFGECAASDTSSWDKKFVDFQVRAQKG
jgi:hypothetical protein